MIIIIIMIEIFVLPVEEALCKRALALAGPARGIGARPKAKSSGGVLHIFRIRQQ